MPDLATRPPRCVGHMTAACRVDFAGQCRFFERCALIEARCPRGRGSPASSAPSWCCASAPSSPPALTHDDPSDPGAIWSPAVLGRECQCSARPCSRLLARRGAHDRHCACSAGRAGPGGQPGVRASPSGFALERDPCRRRTPPCPIPRSKASSSPQSSRSTGGDIRPHRPPLFVVARRRAWPAGAAHHLSRPSTTSATARTRLPRDGRLKPLDGRLSAAATVFGHSCPPLGRFSPIAPPQFVGPRRGPRLLVQASTTAGDSPLAPVIGRPTRRACLGVVLFPPELAIQPAGGRPSPSSSAGAGRPRRGGAKAGGAVRWSRDEAQYLAT